MKTTDNVTIYTATGCPACKAAKQFLDENHVSYTEKNIAEDDQASKELSDRGLGSVPVIDVGEQTIIGFDQQKLKETLQIS